MNLRRTILVFALVVLAGLLAWISFSPLSDAGQLVVVGMGAFTLIAAVVLQVRRWVGSVLALLAGGAGFLSGLLAGLAGLGNEQAAPEVLAAVYLGAGIAIFASMDLVALLLARRPTA